MEVFADDAKIYAKVLNSNNIARLQAALDMLVQWAESWELIVSIDKCCVLNIRRVETEVCININGGKLAKC